MERGFFVLGDAGQYRPATHDEILQFAGQIQADIALDSPGTWQGRELYVEQLKEVLSENDGWLFDAGLLFECSTAKEERDEMVKLITRDWFQPLKGFRRANPPAVQRLAEINQVWRRDMGLCSTVTEFKQITAPSDLEMTFLTQIEQLMPEAVCSIVDMLYVLTRGSHRLPIPSTQRVVRVTATRGIVSVYRALVIPQ